MEPVTTAARACASSRRSGTATSGSSSPGRPISQIGDAAFIVALGWRAFTLTGKASSLGIVLSVEALGLVTTLLIGGVLADRYSRRLLLIGSDVVACADRRRGSHSWTRRVTCSSAS